MRGTTGLRRATRRSATGPWVPRPAKGRSPTGRRGVRQRRLHQSWDFLEVAGHAMHKRVRHAFGNSAFSTGVSENRSLGSKPSRAITSATVDWITEADGRMFGSRMMHQGQLWEVVTRAA